MAEELSNGGEIGAEKYQAITAAFRDREKYYQDVEVAVPKLVTEGQIEKAKTLIDEAIAAVPNEGFFLSAKANLARHLGLHDVAVNYYGKAIKTNPGYFYPYLMLSGYMNDTRQYRMAEQLARRSYSLLPTMQAQQLISKLAQ
ncbi:hypothetical protein OAS86_07345 [Gammaproteobacteria bacterium]|nr:hypothetical protein [Gammaproteobacteria bacterium]